MTKERTRGKGHEKGRRKRRTRKEDKPKHKQIKLSSWLGLSSSVELCPDPEDIPAKSSRKDLRWLHAGIYEDVRYNLQDIWYAFEPHPIYKWKICYARDGEGAGLGNLDVGQIKRNIITFDEHHVDEWRHMLSHRGTWLYGHAMAGRRLQRTTLLATYLNRSFIDPYPEGRRDKVLGPTLNVIHDLDDFSRSGPARTPRNSNSNAPPFDSDNSYPNSRIPLSTMNIQIDAFKNINEDSFKVISDFLTGRLQDGHRGRQNRKVHVDRIESAFYDRGYRVDRQAIRQALQDMHENPGSSAFNFAAFQLDPPIRVDQYKGEDVEKLIGTLSRKGTPHGSDSDNDSENDQGDTSGNDDGDNDDSENDMFVSAHVQSNKKPKHKQRGGLGKASKRLLHDLRRMMTARKSSSLARSQEDSSDGFEYLSDDSPLKGKGPAPRKGASQEVQEVQEAPEVQDEVEVQDKENEVLEAVQENEHVEIDEDRSTPPPRDVKAESPVIRSSWENPFVIDDDSIFEDDSDVEFLEARVLPKKEPSDGIVDMTMVDDD